MWAEQTENSCPQCRRKFNIINSSEQTATVEDKQQTVSEDLSFSLAMELQFGEWGSGQSLLFDETGTVERGPWRIYVSRLVDDLRNRVFDVPGFSEEAPEDLSSFDFLGWLQDFEANVEIYDNQGYTFESVFSPLPDFDLAIWRLQSNLFYLDPGRNKSTNNVGKKHTQFLFQFSLIRASYVYCGTRPLNRQPYTNFRRPKFRKC